VPDGSRRKPFLDGPGSSPLNPGKKEIRLSFFPHNLMTDRQAELKVLMSEDPASSKNEYSMTLTTEQARWLKDWLVKYIAAVK
jgi:hypothetical protein